MSRKLAITLSLFLTLHLSSFAGKAKEYSSEAEVQQAVENLCSHFVDGEFLKGLLYINDPEEAQEFYESIKPLEELVHKTAKGASLSVEVVAFGDLVRAYGILIIFDSGVTAFFEAHFVKIGETWKHSNLHVKAETDFLAVFKTIPKYYLRHLDDKRTQENLAKSLAVDSFKKLGIKDIALDMFLDLVRVANSGSNARTHTYQHAPLNNDTVLDHLEATFDTINNDEVFDGGSEPELLSYEQDEGESLKLYFQIIKDGRPYIIQTDLVFSGGEYRLADMALHRTTEEVDTLMKRIEMLPYKVAFTPKRF